MHSSTDGCRGSLFAHGRCLHRVYEASNSVVCLCLVCVLEIKCTVDEFDAHGPRLLRGPKRVRRRPEWNRGQFNAPDPNDVRDVHPALRGRPGWWHPKHHGRGRACWLCHFCGDEKRVSAIEKTVSACVRMKRTRCVPIHKEEGVQVVSRCLFGFESFSACIRFPRMLPDALLSSADWRASSSSTSCASIAL